MMIIAVALAPVIALIVYFYNKDKYEREPLSLLGKAFLAGCLAIPLVLLVGAPLMVAVSAIKINFIRIFLHAFLVAALLEEGAKFLAFKFFIYDNKEFDEPYDGIMYAIMISLGFAAVENIMYVASGYFNLGFLGLARIGISRAIFSVPAHAMFGVIMGYYFGLAKFAKAEEKGQEQKLIHRGLLLAILAHGLYDFFLFTKTGAGVLYMIILFIICWKLSLKAVKSHLARSPFKD